MCRATTPRTATQAGAFQCFADLPCEGVVLEHVHLEPVSGGSSGDLWECQHLAAGGSSAARDVSPVTAGLAA